MPPGPVSCIGGALNTLAVAVLYCTVWRNLQSTPPIITRYAVMRYVNSRLIYLFTYLLTYLELCLYCRTAWLLILVSSTAAFIFTSADCVLNYISQRHGNHGDGASDVTSLPHFTICNLNPMRSAYNCRDDVKIRKATMVTSPGP